MKSNSQLPTIKGIQEDLREKLARTLICELGGVSMSVAKALDEFIDQDVCQKLTEILKAQRQELKKKVEDKKVPQKDIDKVDEKYKLIYNSHNETIDMFLKLLEERKE
jgi:predicted metal-dependent hydrolase